jgi:SAM-dependent methyltransferase
MHTCSICNNTFENKSFFVSELMFGYRDEFEYFQCSVCGCLQISEVPEDMTKYYPTTYYSYSEKTKKTISNKIKDYLLPSSMRLRMGMSNSLVGLISNFRYKSSFSWIIKDLGQFYKKSVLDVGCGAGLLISYFQKCGFVNLTGIDPYFSETNENNDYSLLKRELYELNTKFNLIMFHHSFEHMDNPNKIFKKLVDLLEDDGLLLIRIPLADSYAFRKYGSSWFSLDAPRHFYLHSVKSMNYLAEKYGFKIDKIIYDSTWQQFYFSESYKRNIALNETFEEFSIKNKALFQKQANVLNKLMDGDQACFYLKKVKSELVK